MQCAVEAAARRRRCATLQGLEARATTAYWALRGRLSGTSRRASVASPADRVAADAVHGRARAGRAGQARCPATIRRLQRRRRGPSPRHVGHARPGREPVAASPTTTGGRTSARAGAIGRRLRSPADRRDRRVAPRASRHHARPRLRPLAAGDDGRRPGRLPGARRSLLAPVHTFLGRRGDALRRPRHGGLDLLLRTWRSHP